MKDTQKHLDFLLGLSSNLNKEPCYATQEMYSTNFTLLLSNQFTFDRRHAILPHHCPLTWFSRKVLLLLSLLLFAFCYTQYFWLFIGQDYCHQIVYENRPGRMTVYNWEKKKRRQCSSIYISVFVLRSFKSMATTFFPPMFCSLFPIAAPLCLFPFTPTFFLIIFACNY